MKYIGKLCMLFSILFIVGIYATSCSSDDDNNTVVEQVTLYVASETGSFYNVPNNEPESGMMIKEKNTPDWTCVSFTSISGFTYEVGYEYELLVYKTKQASSPQDALNVKYELIRIVSKTKVAP